MNEVAGQPQTTVIMNILALETSSPSASLCLADEQAVKYVTAWRSERNHDAFLFPALQRAMDSLGDAPPDYILVGAGPGSYGGVRVALAAAVGISVITGARVVALDSWRALADDGAGIISDARRNGWTYRDASGDIRVLSHEELLQMVAAGTRLYSVETAEHLATRGIEVAKSGLVPTAEGLVRSWLAMTDAEREAQAARPAEPIYVRPPHITESKHKPWEIRHDP